MRAQPRQPPAESTETSKVEHDEQTAHRQVKFIASKFVYGSKPGVKMNYQLLIQHLTHQTSFYLFYEV